MNQTPANMEEADKVLQHLMNAARSDHRIVLTIINTTIAIAVLVRSLSVTVYRNDLK